VSALESAERSNAWADPKSIHFVANMVEGREVKKKKKNKKKKRFE
jgi:hypothetical protein